MCLISVNNIFISSFDALVLLAIFSLAVSQNVTEESNDGTVSRPPGNISEILNSTFLRRIGRSNKKFYDNVIGIWLPVFISQDETSHNRKEGDLPQYHQPPKPHQHEG